MIHLPIRNAKGGMAVKKHEAKRQGLGLEIQSFKGSSGSSYIVFKSTTGSYHVFVEAEAKAAARDCGITKGTTRERWAALRKP